MSEIKEVKKENEVKNVSAAVEFDIFEAQREREESGITTEGSSKVFKTKIPIQTHKTVGKDGNVYVNYGVAVMARIGNKDIPQVMMLRPSDKRKVLYDLLDAIMTSDKVHYLEIVKTTMKMNDTTTVIYGMQVSCNTDEGVEFTCALSPDSRCDKVIFENIKKQLIFQKIID